MDVTRLESGSAYDVKLIAQNAFYTVESTPRSALTLETAPSVQAVPGGSDDKGGYTLQGVVGPGGSEVTACEFKWGPNSSSYAFSTPCSPLPAGKSRPTSVEAHLSGLTPGVVYHYDLIATNGVGTADSGDREFVVTLSPAQSCPNEQIRSENNSLALPECRAYEMVTPLGKEGFGAQFFTYSDLGGSRVRYQSGATNIARSGQGSLSFNDYVAVRSADGWKTIPDLNGVSGSLYDAPSNVTKLGEGGNAQAFAYSSDLLSSFWNFPRDGSRTWHTYLRGPDGTFTMDGSVSNVGFGGDSTTPVVQISDDLQHFVTGPYNAVSLSGPSEWGPAAMSSSAPAWLSHVAWTSTIRERRCRPASGDRWITRPGPPKVVRSPPTAAGS